MALVKLSSYENYYNIGKGNNLYITISGTIGNFGINASYSTTIDNQGRISANAYHAGVQLHSGGTIINGSFATDAVIAGGQNAIDVFGAAGSIANFGEIYGFISYSGFGDGIDLLAGGRIVNGAVGDQHASIVGRQAIFVGGAGGTVINYARILAEGPAKRRTPSISAMAAR
jgi:hypothetical protein